MAKKSSKETKPFTKTLTVLQDLGPVFVDKPNGSRSRFEVVIGQYVDNETGECGPVWVMKLSNGFPIEKLALDTLKGKWAALEKEIKPAAKATKAA